MKCVKKIIKRFKEDPLVYIVSLIILVAGLIAM